MKVIEEDYKEAKCPLNETLQVSLCEEEDFMYDPITKVELKIKRLFLYCPSISLRFSNNKVEEENKYRLFKARKQRLKYEKSINNNRPAE